MQRLFWLWSMKIANFTKNFTRCSEGKTYWKIKKSMIDSYFEVSKVISENSFFPNQYACVSGGGGGGSIGIDSLSLSKKKFPEFVSSSSPKLSTFFQKKAASWKMLTFEKKQSKGKHVWQKVADWFWIMMVMMCVCVCKDKGENKMRTKEKFINFKIFIKKKKKKSTTMMPDKANKTPKEKKTLTKAHPNRRRKKSFPFHERIVDNRMDRFWERNWKFKKIFEYFVCARKKSIHHDDDLKIFKKKVWFYFPILLLHEKNSQTQTVRKRKSSKMMFIFSFISPHECMKFYTVHPFQWK